MKAINPTEVIKMLKNERERIYDECDSIIDECRELFEKEDKAYEESGELYSEYLMSCDDCTLTDDVIELLNDYPVNEGNIELLNKSNEIRATAEEYSKRIENLHVELSVLNALTEALFDAEMRLYNNPVGARFFLSSLVATAKILEDEISFTVSDFSVYLEVASKVSFIRTLFQSILDDSRVLTKQDEEELLYEESFRERQLNSEKYQPKYW